MTLISKLNRLCRFYCSVCSKTVSVLERPKLNRFAILFLYAGMAELADALDSGSSESNFIQVQVLLPAPKTKSKGLVFLLPFRNGCL